MKLRTFIITAAICVAGAIVTELASSVANALPAPMIRFDRSQRAVFEDQSRVIGVNFHRQKGKDFTASAKSVNEAIETGHNWFIIAMTQAQADETFIKAK